MEKDTLLFVHGACHGSWCWERHFVPFFKAQGYPCKAIDLPGHETPGSDVSINHIPFQEYIDAVCKGIDGMDKPPVLIGHSMGGMVIQKALETHPASKVVLLASAPPHGVWGTSLKLFQFKGLIPSLLRRDILGGLKKNTHAAFFSPDMDPSLVKEFQEMLCSESFNAYLKLLTPRVKVNYHTQVPMLVLAGEKDRLFSERDAERTAKKYGAELKVIPDIAHDMMLDRGQERVSQTILDWLEKR